MMKPSLLLFLSFAFLVICGACTNNQSSNTLVPLTSKIQAVPPTTTAISIKNYKPQPGNTFLNIFVSNFSVVLQGGQLNYSTARDGFIDSAKQDPRIKNVFNFSLNLPESAVTGFQDSVLYLAGIDSKQQANMKCLPNQMGVTANDAFVYNDTRVSGGTQVLLGFRDCDKAFLNLNPKLFDSNNNGIPDYLEYRCGMNPSNKIQSSLSPAADGLTNLEKCKRNIPLNESSTSAANQLYAYQYSNTSNTDGSQTFTVNNIPVLNSAQDNFIAVYFVEINNTTQVETLSSAFAILTSNYVGKTLVVPYWGNSGTQLTNQQIPVP
jgi:hypothetical protein